MTTITFTNAQPSAKSESKPAIQALLRERRDVLGKYVDVLEKRYAAGAMTPETLFRARDRLFDAELKLVTATEQRVALYRKRLDNMRALEDLVKKQFDIGQCTMESMLLATAERLQADIELLQEQR